MKLLKVMQILQDNKEKTGKGGIPLKDDRRISILEKLFLYRL